MSDSKRGELTVQDEERNMLFRTTARERHAHNTRTVHGPMWHARTIK